VKWFYDLSTQRKLGSAFGLMAALMIAIGFLGVSAAASANAGTERTVARDMTAERLADQATILREHLGLAMRNAIIFSDEAKMDASIREFDSKETQVNRSLDELEKVLTTAEERRTLTDLRAAFPAYLGAARDAITYSPRGNSAGDPPRMMASFERAITTGNTVDDLLDTIGNHVEAAAKASYEDNVRDYARNRSLMIGGLVLALLIAIVSTIVVGRAVAVPLAKAELVLDTMANGDLTMKLDIHSRDEVGRMAGSLNKALEHLETTLSDVRSVSEEVYSAAQELSSSAENISGGAQTQASSLEETAAALEQIGATVKRNADNAQQAARLAGGARDTAERGGRVVESAVVAMGAITQSSKRIADIIATVDEIAFQTNLLALNAAVEAARAGEQGRGFGVVAAEVRSLAQRTGSAAKEIRALIAEASSRVETGTGQVNESGTALQAIVESVRRVTDVVSEIASASHEQTTGIGEVNSAVSQIDHVTQSNASQTEELAATAESLSTKAKRLQELVGAFQLNGQRRALDTGVRRERTATKRSTIVVRGPRKPTPEPRLLSQPPANGSSRAEEF
jgi:methyl-accepting chemotaxis protein